MRLANRTALVVGGNRGIGQAICLALAREGADVALTYAHHPDEAQTVAKEIRSLGRTALALPLDLVNPSQARAVVAQAIEGLGHLDILVNNSGIVSRSSFLDVSDEEFDESMAVNVKGPFICSQVAARHMVERRSGRIIHITSAIVGRSLGNRTVYATTKGGLNSLTKAMALDLAPYGVTVNSVAPALIRTEAAAPTFADPEVLAFRLKRIPLGRFGQPEDVAGTVVFFCSDDGAFLTGTTTFVDGGQNA